MYTLYSNNGTAAAGPCGACFTISGFGASSSAAALATHSPQGTVVPTSSTIRMPHALLLADNLERGRRLEAFALDDDGVRALMTALSPSEERPQPVMAHLWRRQLELGPRKDSYCTRDSSADLYGRLERDGQGG